MPSADKVYEATVATRFLAQIGPEWKIVEKDHESPDFVIANGTMVVGLELCAYREQGVHNQTFPHDETFKQHLRKRWFESPKLQSFSLYLSYRSQSDGLLTIPKHVDWDMVYDEIVALIKMLDVSDKNCDYSIHFARDDEDLGYLKHMGVICFSVKEYPYLAQHFEFIDLSCSHGDSICLPHSSASARFPRADTVELERVVCGKIAKVPEYRANVPTSRETWLLIHSDGWPPAARIASNLILDRLIQHTKCVLDGTDSFDRVYWLDNACVEPWGPLYPVVKPLEQAIQ